MLRALAPDRGIKVPDRNLSFGPSKITCSPLRQWRHLHSWWGCSSWDIAVGCFASHILVFKRRIERVSICGLHSEGINDIPSSWLIIPERLALVRRALERHKQSSSQSGCAPKCPHNHMSGRSKIDTVLGLEGRRVNAGRKSQRSRPRVPSLSAGEKKCWCRFRNCVR